MNMTYSAEPFDRRKIEHLFKDHAHEAAFGSDPVDVNFDAFEFADKNGALRTFLARDGEEIVGYNVFIVGPDLFRRGKLAATEIGLFMDKKHRGKYGRQFIEWVDSNLNFDILYRGCSAKRDLSPLLKRLHYDLVGAVYGRVKS